MAYQDSINLRKEIKKYEKQKELNECIENFNVIRSRSINRENKRRQRKDKVNKMFIVQAFICGIICAILIFGCVFMKNLFFLKQKEYEETLNNIDAITFEINEIENTHLSKIEGSYFLDRIYELGMKKSSDITIINIKDYKDKHQISND